MTIDYFYHNTSHKAMFLLHFEQIQSLINLSIILTNFTIINLHFKLFDLFFTRHGTLIVYF